MELVFPRRITRLSYFVRNVALVAIGAMLAPFFESNATWGVVVAAVFLIVYWGAFVLAPRCRDAGLSPWIGLLVLVPGVNIFVGGYLTWKGSWPSTDGLDTITRARPSYGPESGEAKSESLKRLEGLRDEGVLTEQDFLRRKARLGTESNG